MYAELDQARVFYDPRGKGTPVLMLHGYFLDHVSMVGCMEPVFAQREGYQRLYLDLPGMGRTVLKSRPAGTKDIFKTVLEFVERVIPGQSFFVVGLSYGGYLARALVRTLPERVLGVLFVCPMIVPEVDKRRLPTRRVFEKDETFLASLPPVQREDFEEIAVLQTRQVWQRYESEICDAVARADTELLEAIQTSSYGLEGVFEEDTVNCEKPVSFIMGRQDSVVGYRDAYHILDEFPQATFAVLDRAGHVVQIEKSSTFNRLVSDWLDRCEIT